MRPTDVQITNMPTERRTLSSTGDINVGYNERMVGAISGPLLAIYGLTRGTPSGLMLAAGGGLLFYRSLTGHCPVYQATGITTARSTSEPLHAEKSVTINCPAEDLYRFWRDFEHLPRFMKHLDSVRVSSDRHSHWVANGPANTHVE
ncbi:MAG: YgaP-like transmembrane domain, partial [Roseiflexaceae bacterium]